VDRLHRDAGDPRLAEWAHVLYSQAVLTLGARIDDPAAFVSRLNDLLVALTSDAPAGPPAGQPAGPPAGQSAGPPGGQPAGRPAETEAENQGGTPADIPADAEADPTASA
jgi:molecular chaperone HtpG